MSEPRVEDRQRDGGWEKLPALESFRHCLNCPPRPQTIPLDALVHPGFGGADMSRDGDWGQALDEGATVQDAEDIAAGDPDHDWRLTINAPLYTAVYQRQGEGQWVLVERGRGFA